jgi:hypothetical protein
MMAWVGYDFWLKQDDEQLLCLSVSYPSACVCVRVASLHGMMFTLVCSDSVFVVFICYYLCVFPYILLLLLLLLLLVVMCLSETRSLAEPHQSPLRNIKMVVSWKGGSHLNLNHACFNTKMV